MLSGDKDESGTGPVVEMVREVVEVEGAPSCYARRVLLAEDNPVNQEVARLMLEDFGCTVDTVDNGRSAVAAVAAKDYELVLMDIKMPEMDGVEATRLIRAHEGESGRHTPIVALTAHALQQERERLLSQGLDDYLSKPFSRTQLVEMLGRRLKSAAPAAESERSGAYAPDTVGVTPLDAKALRQIRAFQRPGATDLLTRVIDLFNEGAPLLLEEIRRAWEQSDPAAARRAAHRLRSGAAQLGGMRFAELCRELEDSATEGRLQEWEGINERLEAAYHQLRDALDQERGK